MSCHTEMDRVSAEVLLSTRVQQMVIAGDEPSGPYICRNDRDDDHDNTVEVESPIPVVDIGCFLAGNWSAEETQDQLQKLKSSLATWGCFQAIGHGIRSSLLEKVRQVGREFFEQPMEEKNKYAKSVTQVQGYGADPVPEEGQSLDWSDRLFIDVVPLHRRDYTVWPQKPSSFKKIVEDYTEEMKRVTQIVSKAMARSLELDENCFIAQFGQGAQMSMRFNYYSVCKRPELVLGLKAHADGTGYTIILQDQQGLQILNHAKWYTLPNNPHSILLLMGDQMEIMTNGVFKSPMHRVVSDERRERISVAAFYTPEVGKEIGPEEGLISGKEAPRLFKTVKDYADIHWEYYQKGMRALHVARV